MLVLRLLDVQHAQLDPPAAERIGEAALQNLPRVGLHVQAQGASDGRMKAIDDQLSCSAAVGYGAADRRRRSFGNESGHTEGDEPQQREGENQPEFHGCGDRMLRVRMIFSSLPCFAAGNRGDFAPPLVPTLMVLRRTEPLLKHAVRPPGPYRGGGSGRNCA